MFKGLFLSTLLAGAVAHASPYQVTITNGGAMPISPGVLYASQNGEPEAHIGAPSTAAFTKLCQTGTNGDRAAELQKNVAVKALAMTDGPILPGESRTLVLDVPESAVQGLYFETMYGKSKDVCGVAAVPAAQLVALSQHAVARLAVKDQVVASGAFTAK